MVQRKIIGLACSLVLLAPLAFRGQVSINPRPKPAPPENTSPKANIRSDTNLVLVPVTVCNPYNQPVTGLEKEHFKIFDDKVEQTISQFSMDDEPVAVGLVFDVSGSMGPKLRESRLAASEFFKTANPEDEFFLVEFNDRPKLSVPFTRDSDEIYNRIAHVRAVGRTSLLDAIHMALAQMKHAHNLRKAIIIFSDGGDNRSRFTEREVKEAMFESDVQVYAMGIFDLTDSRKLTREELNGPQLLTDLAEETGGKHFPVDHLDDLPKVCDRIGNELRNQYLLGYMSANTARDGRYRQIKVLLTNTGSRPQLKPFYRQGYYAPLQ